MGITGCQVTVLVVLRHSLGTRSKDPPQGRKIPSLKILILYTFSFLIYYNNKIPIIISLFLEAENELNVLYTLYT